MAQERVEAIHLDYRAEAANCPNDLAFLSQVRAQHNGVRLAHAAETARTFRIHIRSEGNGRVSGEFSVQLAASSLASAPRSISGGTCREVFEALVVFASLSLAMDAEVASEVAAPEPVPEREATEVAIPRVARPPRKRPPPPRNRSPEQDEQRMVTKLGPGHWFAAGGIQLGAMTAGLSAPLFVIAPFVRVGWGRERAGIAAEPMLRLSASSVGGQTPRTSEGVASLRWTAARIDPCPIDLRPLAALSFRPCLTATLGMLQATGEDVELGNSRRLFWATLGGLARADWRFNQHFSIEIDASVDIPTRRDRFHFEPAVPVYRVPVAFSSLRVGIGIYFL